MNEQAKKWTVVKVAENQTKIAVRPELINAYHSQNGKIKITIKGDVFKGQKSYTENELRMILDQAEKLKRLLNDKSFQDAVKALPKSEEKQAPTQIIDLRQV